MTPRRWIIVSNNNSPVGWEVCRMPNDRADVSPEYVAVMPISEHNELLKLVRGAVELWDEAHEMDDAIALGAAFVGLRQALDRVPSDADLQSAEQSLGTRAPKRRT